jgi:phage tail-like protein
VAAGKIQRRNGTIYLLNQAQVPVLWWNFHEALPLKWTGPELIAAAAGVAFESVELAHRGITRARATTADTAVASATAVLANAANIPGGFF